MKKQDLENRMIVELNDGTRGLIVDDRIITSTGYLLLDNYNDDLTNKYSTIEDVVKIYSKTIALNDIYKDDLLEMLWKRPWEPSYGEEYYYPDFANYGMFSRSFWGDNVTDERMLNDGLVFKTREEAIELAEKMLEVAKEE